MAGRQTGRKTKPQSVKKTGQTEKGSSFFDYFRFSESYTSLILGIVVVIIALVLIISFIRGREIGNTPPPAPEISSTQTGPSETAKAGGVYKVQSGEDLWKIAEKVYKDGYKWVDIARANNITDPNTIVSGMELKLPVVSVTPSIQSGPTVTQTQANPTATPIQKAQPKPTVSQPERVVGRAYTVAAGDTLWDIAVRRYSNGYRWVDIARASGLANPDIIHVGNKLQLPE